MFEIIAGIVIVILLVIVFSQFIPYKKIVKNRPPIEIHRTKTGKTYEVTVK